jgi:hypothetical protein
MKLVVWPDQGYFLFYVFIFKYSEVGGPLMSSANR